ncbi:MAG: hypothetical protein KGP27_19185 [Hyphomicrobiales bacterium]|nr:hypothetical protein [Hyphomicrobiales bacterium]
MKRLVAVLAAALIATATAALAQQTPPAPVPAPSAPAQQTIEPFAFVALGDMPYKVPQDFTKFERLIGVINTLKPAFSIHVGDIKSGSEPCTDEYMRNIFTRFHRFEQPLVFTPGDNEWTDCHRPAAGRYNPRERLAKVREVFYPNPTQSLGKVTLPVEPQSQVHAQHAKYIENTRFWKNGVLFVQVHVVGSNNGFETHDPEAAVEYFERNKANVAWLDDSFKLATDQSARALVISMQANLYDIRQKWPTVPLASGFLDTIRAIERGARQFQKPMLVIQGDEHEFEVDGFRGPDLKRVPNVWRLQLMGADYVHAVRVLVDPASPGVFAFQPVIVWENGAY